MNAVGCLGCASGRCVVHETGGGKRCDYCGGTGRTFYAGDGSNVGQWGACQHCGGVGLRDSRRAGGGRDEATSSPSVAAR